MAREEPTDEGRTRRVLKDEIKLPQTGTITKVREHTDEDDRWNFHVDVRIGPDSHPRKVPVAVPFAELAAPPRSHTHPDGPDQVLVQYLQDDETQRPIVTHILYNRVDRPPLGSEGLIRLRRGSLYVEMEGQGEWARIAKKGSDGGSAASKVEVDDSGETTDINIKTEGNIHLSAGGDITIDEGGESKAVLTEDAVFEYEQRIDTDDGSGGTATKQTTTVSNNETTETQIE